MSDEDKKFVQGMVSKYTIPNLRLPLIFGTHTSIVAGCLCVKLLSQKGISKSTIGSVSALYDSRSLSLALILHSSYLRLLEATNLELWWKRRG
jgi:hypothetical protein